MVELHRILCPIDFSDTSRHALQHGVAIASWYQADLTALHVVRAPFVIGPPPILAAVAAGVVSPEDRQILEDRLREWVEPALRAGVNVDVIVDEGNIPNRILELEDTLRPDLVVMGTHGLGGFDRFILGSITEKVLRKSACPVLTVPPAAGAVRIPYKRLLCPVDFSESSLAALRFAASIAKETDASLTIAHVFDWPSGDAFMERFNEPEFRRLVEHEARERLEALVTDDLRTWCRPATAVAHGKAYREILAIAARDDADLIVMGVRGRNPVDLMLFGSTTNHVVRAAACPVLTLKQ